MPEPDSLETLHAELALQSQFLRSEIGYQSESPGNLRRTVEENQRMLRHMEQTLRGEGDDLGLIGWIAVLRRTWITLVALLGAAAGYLLNDVVDALHPPPPTPHTHATSGPRSNSSVAH